MAKAHSGHLDPQRTLIVFFSRDGHTRQIGHEVAAACHADLEEIAEAAPRDGVAGYFRSAREALLGASVPLKPQRHPPQDYGLVVIGTPVWVWNMSSPVRAWVNEYRQHLHRVAFFCTFGGSGAAKVLADLAQLSGRTPLATLALTQAQCDSPEHVARVRDFAHGLNSLMVPGGACGVSGSQPAAPA
jgi:flavodoxin